MSIRSNLSTGYIANEKDSLNRVIHELRELIRATGNLSNIIVNIAGTGLAQETTLQAIDASLDNIEDYTLYANWDLIPGNSKEFTWAIGTGGARVCTQIVYKTGVTTVLTQTLAYNANDEVTSITAS